MGAEISTYVLIEALEEIDMAKIGRDLRARTDSWTVGELARTIRDRRKSLGLTQEQLADLSGVSPRFLHAVEHAKTTVQLAKFLRVADALGLRLELVLGASRHAGHGGADGSS